MCGIVGFVGQPGQGEPLHVLRRMNNQIVHRGPDDEGYYSDGTCGLAMRRLSIIDLSTGHQPIPNEDETVWIVFNGELYNFTPLRQELEALGHRFRTKSDTEVLVHLYEQYGVEGLAKLRGMFGFAIWDTRRRRLMLARDRFGKKPLYYAMAGGSLYFGSELKSLYALGLPLDQDPEALGLYFQFSFVPDPWTPFRQVRKLPPGHWLLFEPGGEPRIGSYWTMPTPAEQPPANITEDEMAARIRDVFDESVRFRMIADVPLGAFLSGGIDSSSVVASMALQSDQPIRTFSIGFREATHNELPYARMVADQYKTEHHEILVEPDSVALTTKLIRHFGEPFGDSSAIPTYLVSQFAAAHVKVALSGDGGDELFAGYEQFTAIQNNRWMDSIPQVARSAMALLADVLPYSAYGKNFLRALSRPSSLERYFERNYAFYYLRKALLRSKWMLPADERWLRHTLRPFLLPNGADILSQALYFEATASLAGDMLVKVDRMSMANSLEVRSPLLDHHLADLAAICPPQWKIQGNTGKHILLKALGQRLPPSLLNRPKQGFGVPLSSWFRGPLRPMLWDVLTSQRFLSRDFVHPDFLRHLLREHDEQRRDNQHWLWSLLMLELWLRDTEEQTR